MAAAMAPATTAASAACTGDGRSPDTRFATALFSADMRQLRLEALRRLCAPLLLRPLPDVRALPLLESPEFDELARARDEPDLDALLERERAEPDPDPDFDELERERDEPDFEPLDRDEPPDFEPDPDAVFAEPEREAAALR